VVASQGQGGLCCSPRLSGFVLDFFSMVVMSLRLRVGHPGQAWGEQTLPRVCSVWDLNVSLGRAHLFPSAARGAEGNALLCEGLGHQAG